MDLAGQGRFCVHTGIGGEVWKDAAVAVGKKLGMEIAAYSIGFRQDYEDPLYEWEELREVEEDGCVLVRPDRFVAWRSKAMVPGCEEKLHKVFQHVLSIAS